MVSNCVTLCTIASGLFIGMLYLTLRPYTRTVLKRYLNTLDTRQTAIFHQVHKERMTIYLTGMVIGLLLGLLVLSVLDKGVSRTCAFIVTVLGTNMLYYYLHPKSTYMIKHLNTPEQVNAWQDVYRYMQYHQYFGFLLGATAYLLLTFV